MNFLSFLFWGFAGSIVFLIIISFFQGIQLTRINFPFILGTAITKNRNATHVLGLILHFLFGWIFALIYILGFYEIGFSSYWLGLIFGFIHGAFFLTVGATFLPALHPRMASEKTGPSAKKKIEPPGFLGLNYGYLTPVFVMFAHLAYGTIIGLYGS